MRDSGRSWCCGWRKTNILTAVLLTHHQPAIATLAGGGETGALGQRADVVALLCGAILDSFIGLGSTHGMIEDTMFTRVGQSIVQLKDTLYEWPFSWKTRSLLMSSEVQTI